MRILVSNDDGYNSPGIQALARAWSNIAEVDVVAPDCNRSAASNSLTIYNPLRAYTADNGFVYVNGTPADCVHLALTGLLEVEPSLVVAGINNGPNMGEDVLYSGTVGAAMEGRWLGFPALAMSICAFEPLHNEAAARVACDLVQRLVDKPLPGDTILNVNVPDMPYEDIQGIQVTRCGKRHRSEPVIQSQDPRGRRLYWVGAPGEEADAGPGTDFYAIKQGYVSVTPLKVDLTDRELMPVVEAWLA